MASETKTDEKTGRKYFLDYPDDPEGPVTFLLNLHGGGSAGVWQRSYFPAYRYVDQCRLVVATPTAATAEPMRHWAEDADDEHLINIVESVADRFGSEAIRAFWLVGHSQGGMTSRRLLTKEYFAGRVDGWLSLSGGRLGQQAEIAPDFLPPGLAADGRPRPFRLSEPPPIDTDVSFIFSTGRHEIVELPEVSPWAERLGAGQRVRQADVVDDRAGEVHDTRWNGNSSKGWGFEPRPGTAEVWIYPGARDGRVVADVVRLDKGHTEGLEPKVSQALLDLIESAPGGRLSGIG